MGIQINGNTDNITATDGGLSITSLEINQTGISTFQAGINVSGGQLDVGSNIKIGNAGVITATSFVGSGAQLTGITGTTINNNANNRVITGSGTANTLEGEANLTYDGNVLALAGNDNQELKLGAGADLTLKADGSNSAIVHNGDGELAILSQGTDENIKVQSSGYLYFRTGGANERLRITSTGNIEVQGTRAGSLQANDDDALKLFTASTNNSIDRGAGITFYTHDGSGFEMGGTIQVAKENGTADNPASYMRFSTQSGSTTTERLRIDSSGRLLLGTTTEGNAGADDLTVATSGSTGITVRSGTSGNGNLYFSDGTSGDDEYRGSIQYQHANNDLIFATNAVERLRITSGGQVVQYTNHTSGASAHQNTGWYGDDANHYTLEYKDFNEIRAIKTVNTSNYDSIVYKREMMTEYCDIEFTLKGNAPTGSYRHFGMVINGDGSDTSSNWDRLIFRYRPGDTNNNQIRIDKGGGGYGFNVQSSSIPNFFDGNERHIHIQIRKRTFSITVNRMGQSEYNFSNRTNADLVASRGYFGFIIYEESSAGNPEVTLRDFKITNYTQNAIPSTSVAFQVTHSGNPSKSSGTVVKPCNVEQFDNGYGGNFNTSNYRFTAPVAGMYQFGNTFNCYSNPSNMWCGFRVNGSTLFVGNKRNNNTGAGDQNVDAYAIIQLQSGDYVEAVDNTSNSVTYSSGITWNRFEGSLIAAFK